MNFRTLGNRNGIIDSVNADTHRTGPLRKHITGLGNSIVGAIHMQADPKGSRIIAVHIPAIFPGRKPLLISQRQAIIINRPPVKIFSVNLIPNILQRRQLRLHKIYITSV